MAGFLNHIWFKLLDEGGVPMPSASIWIYDYSNPTTQLNLFDSSEVQLTQPISTDSNGVFEFYVKDHIKSVTEGYTWDTQYIISWAKDDKSGLVQGDHLFGEYESVNVSGNYGRLNKAISNFLGWTFNSHVDFMFGTTNRCGSSSSSSSSWSSTSSSSSSSSLSTAPATLSLYTYYKFDETVGDGATASEEISGVGFFGGARMQDPPEGDDAWWTEVGNTLPTGDTLDGEIDGCYDNGGFNYGGWSDDSYLDTYHDYGPWLKRDQKSVSFWIRPVDGQPAYYGMMGCGSLLTDYLIMMISSIGEVEFLSKWDRETNVVELQSSYTFANGPAPAFVNVIVTLSPTNAYMYINGVQTATDTGTWPWSTYSPGANMQICRNDVYGNTFIYRGGFDDLRFYNGILSSSDALDIYNKVI